jgi:two-component system cell cycle response regulator
MSARVLIVDDVPANVKVLEARLTAEYLEVVTATNGPDAIEICERGNCDVVLLDVMMPGMDGHEVCRRLKANPKTAYIPVIMITALDEPSDRVGGLQAGADDFLTKPVTDVALVSRVRSLARLKMLTDELTMRAATSAEMGLDVVGPIDPADGQNGRLLLVEDNAISAQRLVSTLSQHHAVDVLTDAQEALFRAAEGDYDLAIVSLDLKSYDGLRLCSQLRSLDRTRQLPILVLANPEDEARLNRGLDLGVNDYLMHPVDKNEALARVRTQVRRKRFSDKLRDSVQHTIEMAITDALTGLHNRRYLERHLATLVDQAVKRGKQVSVLMLDVDHFKAVNDTYGHDAGDAVLREFSQRVKESVRGVDLVARYGGEEFVIAMPDTDAGLAYFVGERVRDRIASEPFVVGNGVSVAVTISVGIASVKAPDDTPASLLRRADGALYGAKRGGRNRVVEAAA